MATSLSNERFVYAPPKAPIAASRQAAFEARARSRARDQRMFRVLITVTSVFFLPVAVLRKLGTLGATTSVENAPTILADAKGMASSIIPFIFMG
jgi:hypothetical protein